MSSLPFRPGKLTIEDIDVIRATVVPSDLKDHIDWITDLLRPPDVDDDDPFMAIADFHIVEDGYLVGVTLSALVVLPPHISASVVPIEPLKQAVFGLFENVFWTFARSTLRQLAAIANLQDLDLPSSPPPQTSGHRQLDHGSDMAPRSDD